MDKPIQFRIDEATSAKMKTNFRRKWSLAVLTLGLGLAGSGVQAQHGHLNAGATSTSQGSQLYFANGAAFVNTSGFVQTMNYSNSGSYAGYYNSGPTITALAQTTANGGTPHPAAAAFGSFLKLRLETVVSGPAGGVFSFWDSSQTSPTLSLNVAQTEPLGNLFDLSNAALGAGNPGADPYGHLHGRRFTTTEVGDYLVGFRIVDATGYHSDSDLFLMTFRAVAIPEPATLALLGVGTVTLAIVIRRRKQS